EFPDQGGDDGLLNLAGWAKKLTGCLSMTVGGVGLNNGMYDSNKKGGAQASDNLPALMKRFDRGEFDLVGVGRSLLQDPHWARKARLGLDFDAFSNEALSALN
ncbi:12-oxophytodienoate reductase, partial [Pseudomonas sp. SIMBA_065]